MKLIISCFFMILIFYFGPLSGQNPVIKSNWGTIKVKKNKHDKSLPKLVSKRMPSKKKTGIRVFMVRYAGWNFKITFPEAYQSQLFPLLFNGNGLILTDENRKWSDNTVIGCNYEASIGNVVEIGGSVDERDIVARIRSMPIGQYIWISKLYYSDSKGTIHRNEIGEFKIERAN